MSVEYRSKPIHNVTESHTAIHCVVLYHVPLQTAHVKYTVSMCTTQFYVCCGHALHECITANLYHKRLDSELYPHVCMHAKCAFLSLVSLTVYHHTVLRYCIPHVDSEMLRNLLSYRPISPKGVLPHPTTHNRSARDEAWSGLLLCLPPAMASAESIQRVYRHPTE